ncbi:hypothetical protein GALMADRAFT_1120631 [Galerina marginata CBS 339.88]|uniref:F-box domain-containing protein n=1 Tax=Galerina marginata (strain CBS 339.88) TaxID=685588 RepID=A0A067TPZ2_GALM3|nr:hypothetical protein GALMADRAFT_1120631 [Galerina marginata CBS 339.88]
MKESEDPPQHTHNKAVDPGSQTPAGISSMIPAEILLKIFFLLLPEVASSSPYSRILCLDPARSVSQVSRFWRDTALSSSNFWSRGLDWNNYPEKWFKVLLERSGSQDLHVVADLTKLGRGTKIPSPLRKNIEAIQHHTDRVKSLQIQVKVGFWLPDHVFALRNSTLLCNLPALESLELLNQQRDIHLAWLHVDRRFLTDVESANLRVMRVTGLSINFDLPYGNLQILSAVDLAPDGRPHVTKWLHILQGMPNLVELTIKGSSRDGVQGAGKLIHVRLPKLTSLSLAGQVLEQGGIEILLSHIVPSQGCNLYFAGSFGYVDPQSPATMAHMSTFSDAFSKWFGRWRCEDYKSTELHTCLDAKRFIIHNQSGEKPWPGSYFRISVGLGTPLTRQLTEADVSVISVIAQSLVSTLDYVIARTRKLTVWSSPRTFVMSWKDFLSRCSSITTLQITERREKRCQSDHGGGERTINSIFSVLSSLQTNEDKLAGNPLPSLRKVIIVKLGGQITTFDYAETPLPSLRKVTIAKLGGHVVTFDYSDFLGHFQAEALQLGDPITAICRAIVRSVSTHRN